MNNIANFQVDKEKCIGCGLCTKVCPGQLLYLDEVRKAATVEVDTLGWNGCWRCEHCLAVCPKGAIQILGKKPEDSLPPANPAEAAPMLDAVLANRHTCRRYLDKNVPKEVLYDMISRLGNIPNGGNHMLLEYTVIDDKEQVKRFRKLVYDRMEALAAQGVYPAEFGEKVYRDMKRWTSLVRPDMLFCGAPHLVIPHGPRGRGECELDLVVACTQLDLQCAARGLGSSIISFPMGVLATMPEIRSLLQIPENHYAPLIVGIGYPEIRYRRGSQRRVDPAKIHTLTFEGKKET